MHYLTVKRLVSLMGLASALMLGVALTGQYGFDLHPCDLCIYQRIPYAAIVALALLAWVVRHEGWLVAMAWLCVGLLLLDGGIAVYHAGVELGWFPGPSGCSNQLGAEQTLEEMRRAIMEAPLVSCDQAMIHVLGLSMAAWNAIAAFGIAIGSGILLILLNKKGVR